MDFQGENKMNKLQAILIAGLLSLTSVSFASTFNYAAYADGDATGTTAISGTGEDGYASFSATVDGVTVTATGTSNNDSTSANYATATANAIAAYAYLDSKSGGKEAGLGVCKNSGQCDPSNDDNVTGGEAVKLDFGQKVWLGDLGLVDANHETNFIGTFNLSIDSGALISIALSATTDLGAYGPGNTFEFFNVGGLPGSEFYINNITVSAVPVPAAGILFASALLGAGAFGRRKKKAKASVVGAFARAS